MAYYYLAVVDYMMAAGTHGWLFNALGFSQPEPGKLKKKRERKKGGTFP